MWLETDEGSSRAVAEKDFPLKIRWKSCPLNSTPTRLLVSLLLHAGVLRRLYLLVSTDFSSCKCLTVSTKEFPHGTQVNNDSQNRNNECTMGIWRFLWTFYSTLFSLRLWANSGVRTKWLKYHYKEKVTNFPRSRCEHLMSRTLALHSLVQIYEDRQMHTNPQPATSALRHCLWTWGTSCCQETSEITDLVN